MMLEFPGERTTELTDTVGKPVLTYVHAFEPTPAEVDFHNPPLAAPTQTLFELEGSTVIDSTLPPTLFGPIDCHCVVSAIL